jgi:hypothetical protein
MICFLNGAFIGVPPTAGRRSIYLEALMHILIRIKLSAPAATTSSAGVGSRSGQGSGGGIADVRQKIQPRTPILIRVKAHARSVPILCSHLMQSLFRLILVLGR